VLDKDWFVCHLPTVGRVAMHNPRRVDEKTFQLLQRFLFISDADSKNQFLHLCIFYRKINKKLQKNMKTIFIPLIFSSACAYMACIFVV
jgi:hypothetical protein